MTIADIFVGLQTSADDVFIMDFVSQNSEIIRLRSKSLKADVDLEKELLRPLVSGTDIQGYTPLPERQYILFPYDLDDHVRLLPFSEILDHFPKTAHFLLKNQKRLEDREKGRLKDGDWHGYIYLKNMQRQKEIKICVPRLVDRLCAGFDENGSHFLDNVDVGGVTLKLEYTKHNLRYLLGLLNSKLLAWFFPNISAPFRGNWMSANKQFLSQLPIHLINFSDVTERSRYDKMISLVETMLDLNKQLVVARTDHEKTSLQRQIKATDEQIDNLVYEIYGLTEEEIGIVEGKTEVEINQGNVYPPTLA